MTDLVEAIFERWKSTMGHPRAKLDQKRAKAIRMMLAVGYTQEDLELAIFGCSISPFHQGQNDRGVKFEDIGLICRDAEHVDKFIAVAEKAMAKQVRQAVLSGETRPARATAVPDNLRRFIK